MKIHSVIMLVFCVAFYNVRSQVVPGYQGRKNIISYQVNSSPAITRPTYLNRALSEYAYPKAERSVFIPFNFTHGLSYERVCGRRFSLQLDYNLALTKDYIALTQTINAGSANTEQVLEFYEVKMNMRAQYFTGSLVFYGPNSLAPFGSYFKLSFGHCSMLARFAEYSYLSEPVNTINQTTYTFYPNGLEYKLSGNHIGMGFGSNRIYGGKWVVSKGINFVYVFKPDYTYTDRDNVFDRLYTRVRGHDIATIFLKVGYLF